MPDPSHRPYQPMTIIRPHAMPAFWWLVPWAYARTLHRAANALRALCDRQDDLLRGRYTTRPRWEVQRWEADYGVRYYFHDTDPQIDRARPIAVLRGETYLYDPEAKSFAFETDAAKAIDRLTELNAK
jgi:hypothetical protein